MDIKKYQKSCKEKYCIFLEEFEKDYHQVLEWFPETVEWNNYESTSLVNLKERISNTIYAYHSLILSTTSFEQVIPLLEEIEINRLGNYDAGLNGLISDIIPCFLNLLYKIRKYEMLKIYLPHEIKIMETALDKYKNLQIKNMVDNLVGIINHI